MASLSSSAVTRQSKPDVFISFAEDTRDNFTSHVYAALCRKQIQTFFDDDERKRGNDEISPLALNAIKQSKISVIIFSEEYASSKCCLSELETILEWKREYGQMVMPVFCRVLPSDVRKQSGSFEGAFVKHEECFGQLSEKVQNWKKALTDAANLSGWDSSVIRPESKLVDEIVKVILKTLNDMLPSSDCEGLIGIDYHIANVESLLCFGLSEFQIVGIWGMGGIGKTTIAGALFGRISNKFEGSCFLANVREESKKPGGLHSLRDELISKILEEENLISTPKIPKIIKERLQRRKFLIVLDDVNDSDQLSSLIGEIDRFDPGSRVLITTRDRQVLRDYAMAKIYEVKGFNHHEAFQLFCNYAFEKKCSSMEFLELSNKFIDYAKGNPLALKVLGSTVSRKSKQDWEKALDKLRNIPNHVIHNMLKISYDGLDREEQDIFLDIVCFFKGEDRNLAIEVLNGCYLSAHSGLQNLIGKSLITISCNNKLEVHDLLQEMGCEIVRQESLKDPGKRSRVWHHEDVYKLLKKEIGTNTVGCLLLDMSKISELHLKATAFENMTNLRMLKFFVPSPHKFRGVQMSKVQISSRIRYLSDELRYLHWDGYPHKALRLKFNLENLVELKLPYSKVKRLWRGTKDASQLKSIDLSFSEHLTEFPDLSNAPNLKSIYLKDCKSLLTVSVSIQDLTNLRILNLRGCENLRSFPSNIQFRSLITLDLSYCSNLTTFPQVSGNIKHLYLSGTEIKEIPSSIEDIKGLEELILEDCENLETISSSICNVTSLGIINVSGCSKLEKLPQNLGNLIHLKELKANKNVLSQLPPSTPHWKEIMCLGSSFNNLTRIPKYLSYLSSLVCLDLSENNFWSLPTSIKKLSQLRCLYLRDCNMLHLKPELPVQRMNFHASDCKQLCSLLKPPSSLTDTNEPELQKVSGSCCRLSLRMVEFKFINWLKQNQNLADSLEKVFDEIPLISLCLPGSEIPNWFSHQNLGPSMTIELPLHWCNRSLTRFAISAVIAFEKNHYKDSIKVKCSYQFRNNYEDFGWDCVLKLPDVLIESDHMVIGYSPCMDVRLLKGDYATVSFEFTPLKMRHGGPLECCWVKCCGVCPLYGKTNMIWPSNYIGRFSVTSEDLEETLRANNPKRKLYDQEEEELEPHPKRYCRNLINSL